MKSFKNLYPQIASFDNLFLAARKARRGKREKVNTARSELDLERELLQLERELREKKWKPGRYTEFYIHEPKRRLISAAPYRDRVVHHALINVIEPLFERSFIYDSYACRKGKGTHRAIDRFSKFCRHRKYVLKCDIRRYFPSIDHEILYEIFARKIRDRDALWLIRTIIDSSNPQEPVNEYFPGDDLFTPCERFRNGCCGVVRGTTIRTTCAPRTATGTTRRTRTTTTGFVVPSTGKQCRPEFADQRICGGCHSPSSVRSCADSGRPNSASRCRSVVGHATKPVCTRFSF